MHHSESLGELATALKDAQAEFDAVEKTAANPFFKSSYAPLPEVVEAAVPILTKHGLAVTQTVGFLGDFDTLTTTLLHSSGEFLRDTMRLRPVKNDPQGQGSAITYGRRYAYMAILGLVADEDDDGNAASAGQSKRASKKPPAKKVAPRSKPAAATNDATSSDAPGQPAISVPVLDRLRAIHKKSGWDKEKFAKELAFVLDLPKVNDVPAAMAGLSLDQAITLGELMGATAADVTGTEQG